MPRVDKTLQYRMGRKVFVCANLHVPEVNIFTIGSGVSLTQFLSDPKFRALIVNSIALLQAYYRQNLRLESKEYLTAQDIHFQVRVDVADDKEKPIKASAVQWLNAKECQPLFDEGYSAFSHKLAAKDGKNSAVERVNKRRLGSGSDGKAA